MWWKQGLFFSEASAADLHFRIMMGVMPGDAGWHLLGHCLLACLLAAGQPQAAVRGSRPGCETLCVICRPQGGVGTPSRLHPRTKRYYIPTDAQASVTIAGKA